MIGAMFSTIFGVSVGFEIADKKTVEANGDQWAFSLDFFIVRVIVFKTK